MKRVHPDKLRLSRETLRRLRPDELGRVGGGKTGSDTPEYLCDTEGPTCGGNTCASPSWCLICGFVQPPPPPPGPVFKKP